MFIDLRKHRKMARVHFIPDLKVGVFVTLRAPNVINVCGSKRIIETLEKAPRLAATADEKSFNDYMTDLKNEMQEDLLKNQTACGHPTLKDGVCFGPHALTPGFMESRNSRIFVA